MVLRLPCEWQRGTHKRPGRPRKPQDGRGADRRALVLLFLHQDGRATRTATRGQHGRADHRGGKLLEEQGATGSHRKAQDRRSASGAAVPPAQPDGHQDGPGSRQTENKRKKGQSMGEKQTPERARKNYIVESNSIAQTKQNDLTAQQMKIALFFISKIRLNDTGAERYTATIGEMCDTFGIDKTNGAYYIGLKNDLIKMTQREWVRIAPDVIATISWFSDVEISEGSGKVTVGFHEKLFPELFNLRKNFTKFELGEVLPFKSKYAIKLYQIIISKIMGEKERQLNLLKTAEIDFDIEDLKLMLYAVKYKNNADFLKRALAPAIKQINRYSEEIRIEEPITEKDGNKIKTVILPVRYTHAEERIKARKAAQKAMNTKQEGQGGKE